MPLFFKIFLGLFSFTVVTSIIRRMQFAKYINKLSSCDDVKRSDLLGKYKVLIKLHKILFPLSPLYIIITYIIYKYCGSDGIYMIPMMTIVYLLISYDYFFRKKVLNKLDQ